ncbi:MAG TPA: formylmethanofuran dehydrogenase [Methanomicrobia archaeon]|nr:formylmethanofuran dehydrogenase [Methanomicrobia archaeon]
MKEQGEKILFREEIEDLIENGDLKGLLEKSGELHGHLCSYSAYGVKAGYIAMCELGFRNRGMEELVAIVETNNCFSDGIQLVTGCTFGNNGLIFRDYGKTAVTVAKRDGTAIRIVLSPDVDARRAQEYPEAHELFDKIVAKREKATPEEHKRLMQLFAEISIAELEKPADEIFLIKRLNIRVPEYAPIFDSVTCSICGESLMKTRAVIENGKYFCIPCSNREFYQMDGSGISFMDKGGRQR